MREPLPWGLHPMLFRRVVGFRLRAGGTIAQRCGRGRWWSPGCETQPMARRTQPAWVVINPVIRPLGRCSGAALCSRVGNFFRAASRPHIAIAPSHTAAGAPPLSNPPTLAQGSRVAATAGFEPESVWDSLWNGYSIRLKTAGNHRKMVCRWRFTPLPP